MLGADICPDASGALPPGPAGPVTGQGHSPRVARGLRGVEAAQVCTGPRSHGKSQGQNPRGLTQSFWGRCAAGWLVPESRAREAGLPSGRKRVRRVVESGGRGVPPASIRRHLLGATGLDRQTGPACAWSRQTGTPPPGLGPGTRLGWAQQGMGAVYSGCVPRVKKRHSGGAWVAVSCASDFDSGCDHVKIEISSLSLCAASRPVALRWERALRSHRSHTCMCAVGPHTASVRLSPVPPSSLSWAGVVWGRCQATANPRWRHCGGKSPPRHICCRR